MFQGPGDVHLERWGEEERKPGGDLAFCGKGVRGALGNPQEAELAKMGEGYGLLWEVGRYLAQEGFKPGLDALLLDVAGL